MQIASPESHRSPTGASQSDRMPQLIPFAFLRWGNCRYLPPFAGRRCTGASSSCEITAPALDLPEHILTYSHPQSRCFSPRISPSLPDGRRRGMAAGAQGPWIPKWPRCAGQGVLGLEVGALLLLTPLGCCRRLFGNRSSEDLHAWPRLWLRIFKNPGHSHVDKSSCLKAEGA